MAEDKQVKKYFENAPYGNDSKSSEIHGKKNQVIINSFVSSLVRKYDESIANKDKNMASHYKDAIHNMSKNLDNLKTIKEEFALNYGGGTGGKNLFSNYTDLSFERAFFTENGKINFDKNMKPVLIVESDNGTIAKHIEDVTQNWVVKGTEEADFMKMQQDAQKQGFTKDSKPLDFDIDWHVSNLLSNMDAWKSFVSDKIGGRYFLNDYIEENAEAIKSGQIPDEMLHPDSFDPKFDTRLHKYYSSRIKRAFNPDYQTPEEVMRAKVLASKIEKTNLDEQEENIDTEENVEAKSGREELLSSAVDNRFKKS